MAVLVDDARWPAHGRHWAHLVSDTSLEELHAFARAAGLAPRSFDHDHYDVPGSAVPQLVAAGAQPVGSRELVRRLVASGLRVRGRDRAGLPLPEWSGCRRLDTGELFLLGDTETSFDSRYFGPVRVEQLQGVYREGVRW